MSLRETLPHACSLNQHCWQWARIYLNYCLCSAKDGMSLALGLVSVVSWGVAEVPQIITNYKEKSMEGLSIAFLMTWIIGIKKLQNEDSVMRDVRCKRRAQKHWNKLRKYVMYTWGHSNLNMRSGSSTQHGSSMIDSFRGIGSPRRKKQTSGRDSAYLDKMGNIPDEMNILPESVFTGRNKSRLASWSVKFDEILPCSEGEHEMVGIKEDEKKQQSTSLCMENQPELNLHKDKKLSYSCPELC